MNLHSNARLTLKCRVALVEAVIHEGLTLKRAAARFRVSERTATKWLGRFRREGLAGLRDRSSRPHRHPKTTSGAAVAVVLALRRMRLPGFQIAKYGGLSRATVSRILTRHGLAKLSDLDPPPPAIRYQREHPGDLLHIDIKKLGRIVRPGHRVTGDKRDHVPGAGWEFVHVAIDDASRMAYAQIMPDEKIESVTKFLCKALAHFASYGIHVRQLMSDNGSAYRSQPVAAFLRKLGIEHIFTRPYTPRTNGKAERFIQTSLREWAYAAVYQNSHPIPQPAHEQRVETPHLAVFIGWIVCAGGLASRLEDVAGWCVADGGSPRECCGGAGEIKNRPERLPYKCVDDPLSSPIRRAKFPNLEKCPKPDGLGCASG